MARKESPLKEKILEAANRLLGDCGILKLAQPQVAKEANVPQGHLTYYFPKRSDLVLALAEKSLQAIADSLRTEGEETNPDKILPLAVKLLTDRKRTRALVGLLVESDDNPELLEKLREKNKSAQRLIAAALGRKADDPQVALLRATAMGLSLQSYLDSKEMPKDEVTIQLRRLVDLLKISDKNRNSKKAAK